MINALRTRIKYNLTSIRKGMKREILQDLTEMFDREVRMAMSMVHFKESMENDYTGTEVSVKIVGDRDEISKEPHENAGYTCNKDADTVATKERGRSNPRSSSRKVR